MSDLVFSVALNGYDQGFKRCLRSHLAYAHSIGADQFTAVRPTVSDPAFAAWMKLTLTERALADGYSRVAYLDADCEVRAGTPHFAEVLDKAERPIMMAEGRSSRLNSGVIFARQDPRALLWLREVIGSATQPIPAADRANLRFENGNVIAVERRVQGVSVLPTEWNNTFDPDLDDYIRHYTGPLKAGYHRTVGEKIGMLWARLRFPRATPAPETRDVQFLTELEQYTDAAWRGRAN